MNHAKYIIIFSLTMYEVRDSLSLRYVEIYCHPLYNSYSISHNIQVYIANISYHIGYQRPPAPDAGTNERNGPESE